MARAFNVTASGQAYTGRGFLLGAKLYSPSNDGTAILADKASAATTPVLGKLCAAAKYGDQLGPFTGRNAVSFDDGVYVTLSGTGTEVTIYVA